MKPFQIKTKNSAHLRACLRALYLMGYKYHDKSSWEEAFIEYGCMPVLCIYSESKGIAGDVSCLSGYKTVKSIEEIFAEKEPIKVKTSHGEATVRDDGVHFYMIKVLLTNEDLKAITEGKKAFDNEEEKA